MNSSQPNSRTPRIHHGMEKGKRIHEGNNLPRIKGSKEMKTWRFEAQKYSWTLLLSKPISLTRIRHKWLKKSDPWGLSSKIGILEVKISDLNQWKQSSKLFLVGKQNGSGTSKQRSGTVVPERQISVPERWFRNVKTAFRND